MATFSSSLVMKWQDICLDPAVDALWVALGGMSKRIQHLSKEQCQSCQIQSSILSLMKTRGARKETRKIFPCCAAMFQPHAAVANATCKFDDLSSIAVSLGFSVSVSVWPESPKVYHCLCGQIPLAIHFSGESLQEAWASPA